jgi:hypothetical protein
MRTHTAMLTSQLQPIPRKNIWCHSGVTAFRLLGQEGNRYARLAIVSPIDSGCSHGKSSDKFVIWGRRNDSGV